MADLNELSAAQLSALYARGEASPVDVVRSVLARIERCEPVLHATYALDAEGALAAARESQARWGAGNPPGLVNCALLERMSETC